MKHLFTLAILTICLGVCFEIPARAQQCQPPALDLAAQGRNIFTDQQEMDLGDAVFERLRRDFKIIDDPAVTRHLQEITDRLIHALPPTQVHFRVFLLDLPDANALTLPGGRIFVSRKLVAFVNNEDELAGVLAHELGHAYAHHNAIDTSFLFKEVLGVTEVTDRKDIFEKYNRLIEERPRKPGAEAKIDDHEEGQQGVADLIGLFAMARAGYNPEAQVAFWDRYVQNTKPSGNLAIRVFGASSADKKRSAAMHKNLDLVPMQCRVASAPTQTEFKQWQKAVVDFRPSAQADSIVGLISAKKLTPALQNSIIRIRFSPDGRYLLTQDDAGISVVSRSPLAFLFRIDATNARAPQFSPDSREVVFRTTNLRVERWNIAEQKLISANEVYVRGGCIQAEISPDGNWLACFDGDYNLSLINVLNSETIYAKRDFVLNDDWRAFVTLMLTAARTATTDDFEAALIQLQFSPDGRYLMAGSQSAHMQQAGIFNELVTWTNSIVFDLNSRALVPINDTLKRVIAGPFAFVGNDRVVTGGIDTGRPRGDDQPSGLYEFPSGKLIEKLEIPGGHVFPVTRGNVVLLPPVRRIRINPPANLRAVPVPDVWRCTFDLTTKAVSSLPNQTCMDNFDTTIAAPTVTGSLGLYDPNKPTPEILRMPAHKFTSIVSADAAPDMDLVAISNSTHSGVWNLATGEQLLYLPSFAAGYFAEDGMFYGEFPAQNGEPFALRKFDLGSRQVFDLTKRTEGYYRLQGSVIARIVWKKDHKATYTVNDAVTGAQLWEWEYARDPTIWTSRRLGTIVFQFKIDNDTAKEEIQSDPELKQRLNSIKEKEGVFYLKVVEARTGKVVGRLLVETGRGRFRTRAIFAAGDSLVLTDSTNRVVIYSLKTGKENAAWFGVESTISAAGDLLCVQNANGTLDLYDLRSFQHLQQYSFANSVATVQFSADGKKLFVLTQDQTAYVVDTSTFVQPL
jgi:WD40 repeat protein